MRMTFAAVLASLMIGATASAQSPASVAVFAFELEDKSAGAGIIPPDDRDKQYLKESTARAKQMLAESGRYVVVEIPDAIDQSEARYGLRNCNRCEAGLAKRSGAQLALLGVVTRVNRTEHTMFIRIIDADTGKAVAQGFTDLRMGANYAWPRSVKWVMTNRILAGK